MAKEKCTKSVQQPKVALIEKGKAAAADVTQDGYVELIKGESYDLDKKIGRAHV